MKHGCRGKTTRPSWGLAAVFAAACLFPSAAPAFKRRRPSLKGIYVAADAQMAARALDAFIRSACARHGYPMGEVSRVVPVVSKAGRSFVGAAQVTGTDRQVRRVRVVLQLAGPRGPSAHHIAAFLPSATDVPGNFEALPGVGVTALVDVAGWGLPDGLLGTGGEPVALSSETLRHVLTRTGEDIERSVGTLVRAATTSRLVPLISLGKNGYVGFAAVARPVFAAAAAQAVATFQETWNERFRVSVVVPLAGPGVQSFGRCRGAAVLAFVVPDKGSLPAPTSVPPKRPSSRRGPWSDYFQGSGASARCVRHGRTSCPECTGQFLDALGDLGDAPGIDDPYRIPSAARPVKGRGRSRGRGRGRGLGRFKRKGKGRWK